MIEESGLLYLKVVNIGPHILNASYVKALEVKLASAKNLSKCLFSRTVII
jgi:hypothetical protein